MPLIKQIGRRNIRRVFTFQVSTASLLEVSLAAARQGYLQRCPNTEQAKALRSRRRHMQEALGKRKHVYMSRQRANEHQTGPQIVETVTELEAASCTKPLGLSDCRSRHHVYTVA